jgi:hypothetical protein
MDTVNSWRQATEAESRVPVGSCLSYIPIFLLSVMFFPKSGTLRASIDIGEGQGVLRGIALLLSPDLGFTPFRMMILRTQFAATIRWI